MMTALLLAGCGESPASREAAAAASPVSRKIETIDPKRPRAATALVARYFAKVAAKDYAGAYLLWDGQGEASGKSLEEFRRQLDAVADLRADVGAATDQEGAAGSIYITVPTHLVGHLRNGQRIDARGLITLRRVNDVPGSTEAQRRWHIQSSDLGF